MQTGIIGLPQVGKTTLFRILTRATVDEKGARGATHVGVAQVPEHRLEQLAEIYHPKKITHATVEYVDLGGMERDRARDASVLAPLREVDALAHVLRVFADPSVPHSAGSVDPLRDAETLELELMLSDLDQITRRLERLEKDLKKKKDAAIEHEQALLLRCNAAIQAEQPLRELDFTPEESKLLSGFMFLSRRPMLYVLNLGDEDVAALDTAIARHHLEKLAGRPRSAVVPICGRIEAELAELDEASAAELLASYGLKESGLHRLNRATYELLGLISFFTAGEPEVRAWTIRRNTTAVKAAGAIHSDIERNFIRAEVVRCEDLLAAGSIPAAREKGQVRLEGKDYIVQEGDVILFATAGERMTALEWRIALSVGLGLAAAAGNVLGGLFVVRRGWPRRSLAYFLALGAGFMLAASIMDMLPESVRLLGDDAFFFALVGYFIVHFFEHTVAPHFHFGEETHAHEMRLRHAASSALLGLAIHTFFDGVAIASGFLVSTRLGGVVFLAIVLHKVPEGFTVSSLVLAGGGSRRRAMSGAALLGLATVLGVLLTGVLHTAVRYTLPISAGVTLYVAASDLIPEVNQESGAATAILVFLGVALLFALHRLAGL